MRNCMTDAFDARDYGLAQFEKETPVETTRRERRYNDDTTNAAVRRFNDLRALRSKIACLEAQAETAREEYIELRATAYDGIRVQGGKPSERLVNAVLRWADLDAELKRLREQERWARIALDEAMKPLKISQREVLKLYYFEGVSVGEIAELLDYSCWWVKTAKRTGLEVVSRFFENFLEKFQKKC